MNDSRQELLQGLYTIRDHLQQASNARARLQAIADRYQSEREVIYAEDPKTKLGQLIDSLLVVSLIFGVIGSLLSKQFFNAFMYAGILFLIYKFVKPEHYRDRPQRKKSGLRIVLYIIGFPFLLMSFMAFVVMILALFGSPLRAAASVILTAAIYNFISKKREQTNEEIITHNEDARQLNEMLQQEAAAAQKALNYHGQEAQRAGAGWYPRSYYCLYAVNCFIQYIENYQADTVKEMVNLFEDSEHKRRMEQLQQESNDNQRMMQNQLQFMNLSNLMNTQRIQDSIRDGANHITDTMREMRYNDSLRHR